jgi:hypothetical protein
MCPIICNKIQQWRFRFYRRGKQLNYQINFKGFINELIYKMGKRLQ